MKVNINLIFIFFAARFIFIRKKKLFSSLKEKRFYEFGMSLLMLSFISVWLFIILDFADKKVHLKRCQLRMNANHCCQIVVHSATVLSVVAVPGRELRKLRTKVTVGRYLLP